MTATDFDALEAPAVKPRRVGKRDPFGKDERTIQREIVKAGRALGFRAVHLPNGAYYGGTELQRVRQSSKLKADGMRSGAADLLLTLPKSRGGPEMGWVEVKAPGGVLSASQIEFGEECRRDGIKWACVCSVDEMFAVWTAWGWL